MCREGDNRAPSDGSTDDPPGDHVSDGHRGSFDLHLRRSALGAPHASGLGLGQVCQPKRKLEIGSHRPATGASVGSGFAQRPNRAVAVSCVRLELHLGVVVDPGDSEPEEALEVGDERVDIDSVQRHGGLNFCPLLSDFGLNVRAHLPVVEADVSDRAERRIAAPLRCHVIASRTWWSGVGADRLNLWGDRHRALAPCWYSPARPVHVQEVVW